MNPEPVPIQAGGGLVIRLSENKSTEVLLIYRNNCWDLPKGKLEKDETIPECAIREVQEEIGLKHPPEIIADLGTTYHTYQINSQTIGKKTFWYVMKLAESDPSFSTQTEEGITEAEWFPPEKAINRVEYQNLKNIIGSFLKNIGNTKNLSL